MTNNSVKIIHQSTALDSYRMSDNKTEWILLYLYDGVITFTLNSSVCVLQKENALLISPDDFYYIVGNESALYTSIHFICNEIYDFGSRDKIFELDHSQSELLHSLVECEDQTQKELMLHLLIVQFSKLNPTIELLNSDKSRLFSKAVNVMGRYVASSLAVDELANMLRLSLSGLKRIFWKFAGMGVHEYFLMLKINKAKQLLLSGDSVTHIAKVLQFSSQAYFSTTFKRVSGVSAKAYSTGKHHDINKKASRNSDKIHKRHISQANSKISTYSAGTTPASTSHRSDLPDYLL